MAKLFLDSGTLETMLISSAEVYPLEVIGLVFGTEVEGEYNCAVCYPVQLANREVESVVSTKRVIDNIQNSARTTYGYGLLGCYHSHPGGAAEPSEDDVEAVKKLKARLLLMISVEESNRETARFEIVSGVIHIEYLSRRYEIKPYIIGDTIESPDELTSPFMEINEILKDNFGVTSFDLAKLPGSVRDQVRYQLSKLSYETKRRQRPGSEDYSKRKTASEIERIRYILKGYKLVLTS